MNLFPPTPARQIAPDNTATWGRRRNVTCAQAAFGDFGDRSRMMHLEYNGKGLPWCSARVLMLTGPGSTGRHLRDITRQDSSSLPYLRVRVIGTSYAHACSLWPSRRFYTATALLKCWVAFAVIRYSASPNYLRASQQTMPPCHGIRDPTALLRGLEERLTREAPGK